MAMRLAMVLFFLLLSGSTMLSTKAQEQTNGVATPVSLWELVAHGESFDEWRVLVFGFLSADQHAVLLNFDQFRASMPDTASAIRLELECSRESSCANEGYFIVEGIFEFHGRKQYREDEIYFGPSTIGAIREISRVDRVEVSAQPTSKTDL